VQDITFLGTTVEVLTQTESGQPLTVRLPFGHEAIAQLGVSGQVYLGFDRNAAHVFLNKAA